MLRGFSVSGVLQQHPSDSRHSVQGHYFRAVRDFVDADQSGYRFASDVFAKSPSSDASDIAGRAHPRAENLRDSNHGPGSAETWCLLDEGYGKQLDIICSIILKSTPSSRLSCASRPMRLSGEPT